MTTRSRHGFTLGEVLIALAVIGVAFGALALTQVTNLRASVTARSATETKAAANLALERLLARVLATRGDPLVFDFDDYYLGCPAPGNAICSGSFAVTGDTITENSSTTADVNVTYAISAVQREGAIGEGTVAISVTATHDASGQRLTLGDRITCYDVYPSPRSTAPAPCPSPGTGP